MSKETREELWDEIRGYLKQLDYYVDKFPNGREGSAVFDMLEKFRQETIRIQNFYHNEWLD